MQNQETLLVIFCLYSMLNSIQNAMCVLDIIFIYFSIYIHTVFTSK